MNIVVIGSYPLSADCIRGGVESSVFGLVQALFRAGHKVDVFDAPRIGGDDKCEQSGLLTIHRMANPGKHNEDARQRCGDILNQVSALNPDAVHIHGTGKLSGILYHEVRLRGIHVVLTVHGLLYEEKKNMLFKHPSIRHLYQFVTQSGSEFGVLNEASTVIVDTEYVAQAIRGYYEKRKIKHLPQMYVIPQGINLDYYRLRCAGYGSNILSVGAISARKGHLFTVQMFNMLRSRGINATLRIIGSLADKEYYRQLLNSVQESPFSQDIWVEVNVSQAVLFEAYKSASLFVLHSQEESQGIAFAEAMATGMPIVATKVGGVPYVVENGKSGLLCEYGNAQAMSEHVEHLLSDSQTWQSYSDYARQISEKYNWDTIAEQISRLYAE